MLLSQLFRLAMAMLHLVDPPTLSPPPGVGPDAEEEQAHEETFTGHPREMHALTREGTTALAILVVAAGESACELVRQAVTRDEPVGGILAPEQDLRWASVASPPGAVRKGQAPSTLIAPFDLALPDFRARAWAKALLEAFAPTRVVAVATLPARSLQGPARDGQLRSIQTTRERHRRNERDIPVPLSPFEPGMLLPGPAGAALSAMEAREGEGIGLVAAEDGPCDFNSLLGLGNALDAEVPGGGFREAASRAATELEREWRSGAHPSAYA